MMTEYPNPAKHPSLSVTGRELQPGEKFYTALLEEGNQFVRRDYSTAAWQGPPPQAFSFWCGRVPAREETRRPRIDDEMLVECFNRLEGQTEPGRMNFRFVVALLLMRRKHFKFEEARKQGDQELLILKCVRTGAKLEVVHPRLTDEQMTAVQEEVFQVLGWQ